MEDFLRLFVAQFQKLSPGKKIVILEFWFVKYILCVFYLYLPPSCVRPAAFIKSHQGTNKSVCTLIKQSKKASWEAEEKRQLFNGLPRELESAFLVVPLN